RLYFSSQAIHTIAELRQNQPELFPGTAKFRSLNAHYGEEELIEINAEIELLSQDLNHIQERVDLFSMELSKALNQTVRMNVDITPYLQYSSQSQ
ncbi:MAG: DUF389 domain-containing protein, partial [Cyanobacteria bacterium]|nr:DUF389 domain-containing protein [Cyanobacteria bacterium GSL.Bin21]